MIRVFEEFVQGDAEVLVSAKSQNLEVFGSLKPEDAFKSSSLLPSPMRPHHSLYHVVLQLFYRPFCSVLHVGACVFLTTVFTKPSVHRGS